MLLVVGRSFMPLSADKAYMKRNNLIYVELEELNGIIHCMIISNQHTFINGSNSM